MMTTPRPLPGAARDALLAWFDESATDYPWRRTTDPYAILVSEMMLQQTRVQTVLDRGYFSRWMTRFPDVATLATADEPTVLRLWEGLGYYTRARNLLRTARTIVGSHGGHFPSSPDTLRALPGIGPYTANAIAAFAFNATVPVLDANAIRVATRWFRFTDPVDNARATSVLSHALRSMIPPGDGRRFGSAVMELGQHLCMPRTPHCDSCPVARWCRARTHSPESLPVKRPRPTTTRLEEHTLWHLRDKALLLRQSTGRRRHGLWQLPARPAQVCAEMPVLHSSVYPITRFRVRLTVHLAPPDTAAKPGEHWLPIADLDQTPLAAPYRRAITAIFAASPTS